MEVKIIDYHLSYYHILIFVISNLWSGTDSERVRGYSINVPNNVTAQQGLCVYIPCSFIVPRTVTLTRNAKGIWYKDEVSVASKSNTWYWNNGRFSLVGDVWRGDCSLYIEDPLYTDEGRYRFRVEDNINFNYLDIQPYVKVTDLKNKPEISPIKSFRDGEKVTLRCTSPGTCVRINPQFTWRGNIQIKREKQNFENHENRTKTHFSTITFTARKEHNNCSLSCTVELRGVLTTEQEITMKVEYPPQAPKIKCSIYTKEPNIPSSSGCTMDVNNAIYPPEGSQLSLTCSAESVPESFFVWKSSTGTLTSSSTAKLIVTNLSLTDEGKYTCQATNTHGSRETSIAIKITYSPKTIDGRCRKVENRLECTCLSQSFPEPTLKWKHNGVSYNKSKDTVNIFTVRSNSGTNSTLTLQVNAGESQNIQCVASNLHGELVKELFNETAQLTSKAFPSAAIFGGCFAALLIAFGVLLIIFYRKRRMTQNKEASRSTHVDVVDNIYSNSEMFSNGPHGVGRIPEQDHQPPPEGGSVHLSCQNVQYMSIDFSKLKPKVTDTDRDAEEVEYSVVKRTN